MSRYHQFYSFPHSKSSLKSIGPDIYFNEYKFGMKWLKTSRRKTLYTSQLWVFTIVSVSKHYKLSRSSLIKAILEHRFVNKSMGLTEKLLQQQVLQQLRFWVSIESKKDSWMCHWNIVSASQSFCKFLIVETISYGHMILD